MLTRRYLILAGASALALIGASRLVSRPSAAGASETFEVTRSDAKWRKLPTPAQYSVLRQEGTERPYSSSLNNEKRAGKFACAGCDSDRR